MEAFRKETEYRKKTGVAAPEEDRPMYVIGMNTPRRSEVIADALLKRGYSARVAGESAGRQFRGRSGADLGVEISSPLAGGKSAAHYLKILLVLQSVLPLPIS